MFRFFGRKMFIGPDTAFKKLFDVIPQELGRDKTREYLSDFTHKELPGEEGVHIDIFKREGVLPTNEFVAIYDLDGKAKVGIIHVEYTPKIGKISFRHVSTLSKQIDKFFKKENYEYKFLEGNIYYWQKGDVVILKQVKNSKFFPGYPKIEIYIRNVKNYSFELIREVLIKEYAKLQKDS